MSAQSKANITRALQKLASVPAILAVSLTLAGADSADASGRVKDEVSRTPVFYKVGGNCFNASCRFAILTTPGGKNRIEIASITCNILTDSPGYLSTVVLKDGPGAGDRAMYMNVDYTATSNGNRYHTVTSNTRLQLKKNTTYSVLPVSTSDVNYTHCTAIGEKIKYKN